jgi:ribonuclease HI
MVLFETMSQLNYIGTNVQAECEVLLFGLEILQSIEVKHVEAFGDSLLWYSCIFEGMRTVRLPCWPNKHQASTSEGIFFLPKGSLSDAESSSLVLVN